MKKITVEQVAMEKNLPKNKIYFTNTDDRVEELASKRKPDVAVEDPMEKKRTEYNNSITTLDPKYTALAPINSFIVRIFVRDKMRTESGVYLQPKQVLWESRNSTKTKVHVDPWQFTSKAVIVSVPSHETYLKPGDIVQIVSPQSIASEAEVLGYEYQYAHPDYMEPQMPKDPQHQHFGYAIIHREMIKVLINEME